MFEVVGEPRRLGRVVLTADADRYIGLDSRLVAVHAHKNFQPVGKRIDERMHRIVRDGVEIVGVGRGGPGNHQGCSDDKHTADK